MLLGLVEEFGPERVIDSPISEAGITGIGVGAAMTGMRPVVDIMFGDFLTLVMDQLANQAAKVHYMSGGSSARADGRCARRSGATRRSAAQHSQSLHAWVSHIPGLKVALPSTPYDAKGLLKAAIRDDNPVVFFEDKMIYATEGAGARGGVRDSASASPTSSAQASDVTIVATSSMVYVALEAAELLAARGHQRRGRRSAHDRRRSTRETLIASAREDRPRASSSTRATRATACRPSSPRSSPRARSTTSTRP